MKKTLLIITFLLLTFCKLFSKSGGQPGQLIQFGANARTFGLGKAFFAVSDDANAPYFNQAGLGLIERTEITALHAGIADLFPGTKTQYDYISLVIPTIRYGTFGLSLLRLFSWDFKKIEISVTPDNIEITEKGTFDIDELALILAYGKRIFKGMNIGGGVKCIRRRVDTHSDFHVTTDIAMLYEGIPPILPTLKLAAGVRNLIDIKSNTRDDLPAIFRFGISNTFFKNRLLISLDIEKNVNARTPNFFIGAEYKLMRFFVFRFGLNGETSVRETNFGLGFHYKNYSFDYALAIHGLGLSHRLSATWRFGRPITGERERLLEKLTKEAEEYIRRGNFSSALQKLEDILGIDPKNKTALNKIPKLQKVVPHIQTATEDNEVATGIRKAVESLLKDDLVATIDALKYAYFKEPSKENVRSLLNQIEKEIGVKPTEKYRETIMGWTLTDQKIYKAQKAILDGKPEQALIYCQEVLNLEPNNVGALKVMGSAFYMMNQLLHAERMWRKALELDPEDETLRTYLGRIKRK